MHTAASSRWVGAKTLAVALVAVWVVTLTVFRLTPSLDISISTHFFDGPLCDMGTKPPYCGSFTLGDQQTWADVRSTLYRLPYIGGAAVTGLLVAAWFRGQGRLPATRRLAIALATLVFGVGFIANGILKEFSGRPRPRETTFFGGHLEFMPAGSFGGGCAHNCSFVSGEAAGAGWLLCLVFLLPAPYRKWVAIPTFIVSVASAALRVAFGGHFASDAILGWLLPIALFATIIALEPKQPSDIATPPRLR